MSRKSFILSSTGLKNIIFPTSAKEDQFIFVFGEQEIRLHRFFAEFISPRVAHIHQTDPTIDRLQLIPTKEDDSNKDVSFFSSELIDLFKQISEGNEIYIDEDICDQLQLLSIFLDNSSLYDELGSLFSEEIECNHIDKYLKYAEYIDLNEKSTQFNTKFSKDKLIEYISSHFYLIDKERLFNISKQNLYEIISNDHLKITSESSLFEFINEVYSRYPTEKDETPRKVDFYEQIAIDYLSLEEKKKFILSIEPDEMTSQLWRTIQEFISSSITTDTQKTNKPMLYEGRYINVTKEKYENILYNNNANDRFNGIISKLSNNNPKDALKNGIINITSSSVLNKCDHIQARNVVDYGNDKQVFQSKNKPNSWLCIDFKENKVKPSHYSIRSADYGARNECLQHWCIEGSNDQQSWKPLDVRSNVTSLLDNRSSNTFEIQTKLENNEYYQYLRIRQTGLNSSNNYELFFSSIEFFGTIQTP